MKTILLSLACYAAFMAPGAFADEPNFIPGGPSVAYLAAANTSAATEQVTASGDAWIVGVAYMLESSTSEVKIKDAATGAAAASLEPVFHIGFEANKTGVVEFPYPIHAANGIVAEATGARMTVYWMTDVRRRRLPWRN
ncbi:hypothetical protein K8I31_00775 [bacterium]|nr:hypothetical protein [bacterium]